jgi:hypothetical protein
MCKKNGLLFPSSPSRLRDEAPRVAGGVVVQICSFDFALNHSHFCRANEQKSVVCLAGGVLSVVSAQNSTKKHISTVVQGHFRPCSPAGE